MKLDPLPLDFEIQEPDQSYKRSRAHWVIESAVVAWAHENDLERFTGRVRTETPILGNFVGFAFGLLVFGGIFVVADWGVPPGTWLEPYVGTALSGQEKLSLFVSGFFGAATLFWTLFVGGSLLLDLHDKFVGTSVQFNVKADRLSVSVGDGSTNSAIIERFLVDLTAIESARRKTMKYLARKDARNRAEARKAREEYRKQDALKEQRRRKALAEKAERDERARALIASMAQELQGGQLSFEQETEGRVSIVPDGRLSEVRNDA